MVISTMPSLKVFSFQEPPAQARKSPLGGPWGAAKPTPLLKLATVLTPCIYGVNVCSDFNGWTEPFSMMSMRMKLLMKPLFFFKTTSFNSKHG